MTTHQESLFERTAPMRAPLPNPLGGRATRADSCLWTIIEEMEAQRDTWRRRALFAECRRPAGHPPRCSCVSCTALVEQLVAEATPLPTRSDLDAARAALEALRRG